MKTLPDSASVHHRWLAAMRAGDFERAWRETDRVEVPRRRRGDGPARAGELRWDGSSFAGRHVLVRCLHGLGDTLQFARFVPLLCRQAASVTFAVQPDLLPLFPPDGPFGRVCNGWTDDPLPCDLEIEVMELAYAFRSTVPTLPTAVPYLDVSWITQASTFSLPRVRTPRVGVIWEASAWDPSRSLPAPLLAAWERCGVEFYALQQHRSSASLPPGWHDLATQTVSILDAARAMQQLDLILSVDTMAPHLAGALGRPVWLLLKHEADWRWMEKTDRSPWYPTMQLYRQPMPGDWATPVQQVGAHLRAFPRAAPCPHA